MGVAEAGLDELDKQVETRIVIPNQTLFRVSDKKTTFADAFRIADEVLHSGVRGVTDLMVMPGLINLDFADIQAVMAEMGKAIMGTGESEGENRALEAAEASLRVAGRDDPESLATLAMVYYHLQDVQQAIELQTQAYFIASPRHKPRYQRVLGSHQQAGDRGTTNPGTD